MAWPECSSLIQWFQWFLLSVTFFIRSFPEIGVPPVLIHLNGTFPNHPFGVTPYDYWNPQKYHGWVLQRPERSPRPLQPYLLRLDEVVRLGGQNHESNWSESCSAGWWFGTFYIFPYIGNNHPNWLSYFSEGWPNHQPEKGCSSVSGFAKEWKKKGLPPRSGAHWKKGDGEGLQASDGCSVGRVFVESAQSLGHDHQSIWFIMEIWD